YADTRFLARLELLLGEDRPLLLSSTVKEDNDLLTADLTNPDILRDGGIATPRGAVHLFRAIFLQERCCYQRVRVTNYARESVDLTLRFRFENDFADLFEVRGLKRARRGRRSNAAGDRRVELCYEGLDGVARATRLATVPAATEVTPC